MFFTSIAKSDLARLNGSGVQVAINGQPRVLRQTGQILFWMDESGLQERKIITTDDQGTHVWLACANDATNSDGCEVLMPAIVDGRVVVSKLK
jgi:hypothetical protein